MEQTLQDSRHKGKPPVRFGGYAVFDHLGKGGMGDVYKAIQLGLDRTVALKILPPTLARSREFSERFFSEAYAISRLQHQNIVTIYDYGEEQDQKYIAMQYIHGPTLSQLLQAEKSLNYARIINIVKQVCRGLKYAHQCDIVHRDIKSGNIMVEPGDKVYITDFGIAKVIDSPGITTIGMTMGTPEFMSPEQCEGGVVDGQSDIYGLGIILYEMVTGKPPFLAESPLAVAYKQVHEIPSLLSKIKSDIPPRLELIAAKCLKKNKADRYRNADELLKDLDSVYLELPKNTNDEEESPANQRITDRREAQRRDGLAQLKSQYTFWLLGLVAFLLAGVLIKAFFPSAASNWVGIETAQGDFLNAENGPMKTEYLFDGKLNTAWAPPKNTHENRIYVQLKRKTFLTGIVLETGFEDVHSVLFSGPRTVTLELEGHKSVKLNLSDTNEPQYLLLNGLVTDHLNLVFEGAFPPEPAAIREIKFTGLPYE
jgi:serine/threonine protein kinase